MTLGGIPVYVSENLVEQYRFPRTKKRRIRNKWAKRPINFRPSRKIYQSANGIYVHPIMMAALRNTLGDAISP